MSFRNTRQEDYLLRVIREAAEALRRLRGMITESAQSSVEVRAELALTIASLLGPEGPLLQQLDADTAVQLLNDERILALWTEALDLQADTQAVDICADADATRRRADALRSAGARFEASHRAHQ